MHRQTHASRVRYTQKRKNQIDYVSSSNPAVSPDGETLAVLHCGKKGHQIWLHDVATAKPRLQIQDTPFPADVTFSPDGRFLAGADHGDGAVRIWDAKTGQLLRTAVVGAKLGVARHIEFSRDSWRLVVLRGNGTMITLRLDEREDAQRAKKN